MALLSPDGKTVIVRIVYGGPSCAGKTTTLYALARELLGQQAEQAVFTPATEDGHTLYFDWLDYKGGRVQGRYLRSHILTVPGLEQLAARRQFLLQHADAVVFVVDAQEEHMPLAREAFQEMQPWLQRPDGEPAVGVMIQANKHDLPGALSAEAIKQYLGSPSTLRVVSTIATDGTGIREAFVKGVGLALERVLVLLQEDCLPIATPDVHSSVALFQTIKAAEKPALTEPEAAPLPVAACLVAATTTAETVAEAALLPIDADPVTAAEAETVAEAEAEPEAAAEAAQWPADAGLVTAVVAGFAEVSPLAEACPFPTVAQPFLDDILLEDMLATREPVSSAPEILEAIDLQGQERSATLVPVLAPADELAESLAGPDSAATLALEGGGEQSSKTSPLRQKLSTTIRSALSRIEELTGVKRRDR